MYKTAKIAVISTGKLFYDKLYVNFNKMDRFAGLCKKNNIIIGIDGQIDYIGLFHILNRNKSEPVCIVSNVPGFAVACFKYSKKDNAWKKIE